MFKINPLRVRLAGAALFFTIALHGDRAQAAEPFNYFVNDWNVVGLKDYRFGTRLSPNHKLLIGQPEWRTEEKAATVQIRFGRDLKLPSRQQNRTCIENWIPVFQCTAPDGDVQYDFTIWATPLPSVKDWKKAYDWPTEGEDYLTWIWVKIRNQGTAPAPARLKFEQAWSDWSRKQWPNNHPVPSLAEPIVFDWPNLEAGADTQAVVRLSWVHGKNTSAFDKEDPQLWMDRTIQYWRDKLAGGALVEVPCKKATQAMKAAHVCQLLAADGNDGLHAGEGPYDGFYVRDGAYQMMQLEEADLMGPVMKTLEVYLRHQRGDGLFDSQGQFDGNGQAQWVLWQYYNSRGGSSASRS
jgi:hypothetical protein